MKYWDFKDVDLGFTWGRCKPPSKSFYVTWKSKVFIIKGRWKKVKQNYL